MDRLGILSTDKAQPKERHDILIAIAHIRPGQIPRCPITLTTLRNDHLPILCIVTSKIADHSVRTIQRHNRTKTKLIIINIIARPTMIVKKRFTSMWIDGTSEF